MTTGPIYAFNYVSPSSTCQTLYIVSTQNEYTQTYLYCDQTDDITPEDILATMELNSIPGMRESILEGMNTPLDECTDKPDWL